MVIVSAMLSSMLYIDNAEARGKVQAGKTESQFLTYCEGDAGKSATDHRNGKYYCCLKNDDVILDNKCITCDVDRSGNKSNCVAENRVPRSPFQPPMKNTNGNMAPAENPPATRRPPSRINNGSNTDDWNVYRR